MTTQELQKENAFEAYDLKIITFDELIDLLAAIRKGDRQAVERIREKHGGASVAQHQQV